MLVRCLYASHAKGASAATVADEILVQSRKNNPLLGITGALCYTQDVFVQALEGGRDQVCELFSTIIQDPRHENVRILVFEEIGARKFGSWTMGKVAFNNVNQSLILKYSPTSTLDPFKASGHQIAALLDELLQAGAITGRP